AGPHVEEVRRIRGRVVGQRVEGRVDEPEAAAVDLVRDGNQGCPLRAGGRRATDVVPPSAAGRRAADQTTLAVRRQAQGDPLAGAWAGLPGGVRNPAGRRWDRREAAG